MVGLRFAPSDGDHNLVVVPTDSCPEAMKEDDSPKVKEHLYRRDIYVLDEKFHHLIHLLDLGRRDQLPAE